MKIFRNALTFRSLPINSTKSSQTFERGQLVWNESPGNFSGKSKIFIFPKCAPCNRKFFFFWGGGGRMERKYLARVGRVRNVRSLGIPCEVVFFIGKSGKLNFSRYRNQIGSFGRMHGESNAGEMNSTCQTSSSPLF